MNTRQCDYCLKDTQAADLTLVECNLPDRRGESWWACPTCYKPIASSSIIPNDPVTQELLAEVLAKMYRHYLERQQSELTAGG